MRSILILIVFINTFVLYAQNRDDFPEIHQAVKAGDYDKIKALSEDEKIINLKNYFGETPLHIAVEEGQYKISRLLLRKGAKANARDRLGWTPLMLVRSKKLTKLLLRRNAQPNALTHDSVSVLMIAVQENNMEKVKILIRKGANVHYTDKNDKTVSDYAIQEEMHRFLIKKMDDIY